MQIYAHSVVFCTVQTPNTKREAGSSISGNGLQRHFGKGVRLALDTCVENGGTEMHRPVCVVHRV